MTETRAPSVTKYLVIAAILQAVWGLVPSASKFVIDEIPVELYIAVRWSISGLIFAIYLFATKTWKPVALKDVLGVSLLGALGYGVASLAMLYGLKFGGVTNFTLIGALGPLITSLTAIFVLSEKPEKLFWIALPISILGLILLVLGKYQASSFEVAGFSAVLIVSGCFMEALVFVYSKRFKARMSAVQYLTIAQIATAILMWISQAAYFQQTSSLAQLTPKGITAAIFVSVVACVLCYAILYWLLNFVDGHRLALFDSFHALSGTLFGYFLFHEELKPLMILGGVLILTGLVAGNLPKNAATESPE